MNPATSFEGILGLLHKVGSLAGEQQKPAETLEALVV